MAYLDHITLCNAYDIGKFRPLMIGDSRIGWVRYDIARHLVAFPEAFRVRGDAIGLHPALETPAARSDAVDEVARVLAGEIGIPALRGERYPVMPRWGGVPLMTVDRGVVSVFGVPAYGVHVNGMVRRADGLHLWIGRRAPDRPVAPGQLDNMVAGGQPAELGLMDNLVKEAAEEAAVPEALARTARPVGAIRYCLEDQWGLKPDLMFCYDLDLPEDFTPRNTDGEISGFQLLPVAEVAARVKSGGEFKFNVNLVILDFLVRHGLLSPDHEPDYVEIVMGLRRGW